MWRSLALLLASALWPQSVPAFLTTCSSQMRYRSAATRMATTQQFEPVAVMPTNDRKVVGGSVQLINTTTSLSIPAPSVMAKDDMLQSSLLNEAYIRSGEITKIFSKTFYFGSTLMSDEQRKAVWAIYVWCRRTDDIVDSPVAMLQGTAKLTQEIQQWEGRLERIWEGVPTDVLDLALADTVRRYPDLSIRPFKDMVMGMLMDTPGHELARDRYDTWDELYEYCYRVAGTVGLMTLPIMGTAEGYTMEQAEEPANALGIAFQITNILRDVGEDAVRGRIYLPREDMERFGVTEKQIFDGYIDDNYRNLIKFEIQRARDYYAQAEQGIPMLAPSARLPVRSSLDMYSKILRRLEENEYDNFRKRAYVSKLEKIFDLPLSWWRTLPQNMKSS